MQYLPAKQLNTQAPLNGEQGWDYSKLHNALGTKPEQTRRGTVESWETLLPLKWVDRLTGLFGLVAADAKYGTCDNVLDNNWDVKGTNLGLQRYPDSLLAGCDPYVNVPLHYHQRNPRVESSENYAYMMMLENTPEEISYEEANNTINQPKIIAGTFGTPTFYEVSVYSGTEVDKSPAAHIKLSRDKYL